MLTISAYHLVAQLYESANSLVYRGRRVDTEQPVVLKMLKESYPTPERTAWFKQEYEVTRNLTIPGVVDAYALFRDAEAVVMVLEDFGGDSLDLLAIAGQLELCEFLKLAIAITDILGQIHAANIIHKDINPSNIVLNPTTGQVKIIDFGISTVLSRENPTLSNPNILEGTLAYISPEQTGRMNRAIDYRSDFYSLGATFYKLLTGILPFQSLDLLELVHSHIAKQPVPPHEVVGTRDVVSLPSIVSDIVMKLMAKNAEDRYQSAYGLKADLEICLHQLQTNGQIDVFALGEQDISERFTIGQKLYGREREIETLLEAFTRVAGGETENSSISTQSQIEMILVTGYSGVGKSALVREVHKPITARRGSFIWGKFDQYQRNIPYYALSQAFDDLCKQLLTETEAVLNQWREKILAAVGNNGQVLIDVIPNLERVIGTQPPVVQVEASIAQNRFNLVFQNFIKVICQKSHPLVLFIDDLQWADKASLKLLKTIMSDATIQYLLIIGAYRDNEVNPSHPLMMTLEEIEKKQAVLSSIHLDNLLVQDVNALIAEALKSQPTSTQPLTDLVYDKTQGNAFFTTEFLKSLYTEGLLTFEYPPQSPTPLTKGAQRGVGGWQWDVAQIQAKDITDNVVELMAAKIGKLPTSTQMVLQLAACIGNKFDLSTLGIIYQHQPAEALADLLSAIQKGLIVPLDNKYKLIETEDDFAINEVSFKFLHDRVQQAAYALIDETEKTAIHLKIGRLLLHNTAPEALSEKLFEIVDHLNLGSEFISDQAERDEIAKLNLRASEKAKSAMAYEAAVKYLNVGLNLLAEDSWQTQYDLTLSLYESAVYAEYLNTNYERSELLSNVVLQQVKTVREKANVYETKIQLYIAQNQMQASIDIGLQFLKMLGISLSKSPPSQLVIDDLYNLPPMTDPDKLVAMRILKTIWSPVHTTNSSLAPLIIFTMMELCVNYGNSSFAAFAYVLYGFLLCKTQCNLDFGYQLGKLSLKMLKQFDSSEIEGKVNLLFNCFIRPWKEHKRNTLESLQETLKVLMETGDIEYASYAAINYCSNLLLVGDPLESVNKTYKNYISLVQSIKQDFSLHYAKIWGQLVLNLMADSRESNRLVGELFNETEMLPILQINNNLQSLFVIELAKTRLNYLFKNYTAAVKSAENAAGNKQSLSGLLAYAEHNLYYSLSLLANYLNQEDRERKQYIKQVAANQKEMKTWAVHAPMNFQHTYDLVEAEKARVLGQVVEAMDLYERAIKGARDNGYIQEEALAYELAANFYLARGMQEFAQLYMTKAHYGYVRWGAKAKVKDLEQQYPQFFAKTPSTSTKTTTTILSTDSKASSELDLNSILKAFGVNRGGFPLEAYIGRTDDEIHPKEVTNAYLPLLQKTVETRTKQTGECNISLPGCSFTIVVTYVPILNEHGEIHQILGITHDITERKRAEEQLLHNAFHDALTGLPNRAWFMECLKDAIERAKQQENYLFAVLFLDLDRFKVINDSLGHLVGDQFLIKIASRLKACLRSIDTAARLGGDEFTILLEGIENLSEAIEVVELIQQQLALPFDLDGQEVFTTASIGIALNSILTYDQPENLLRDADTAMYRAKVLGRARYELFNPDMYTNAVDRLQLETDLRRAIERQEFRVYYQPIVSLSSGTISGFEALLRWQHPERGLVYPADFIPLAEETGLIVEIGYWVLFEACRQMQVWQMRYPTSFLDKISVNLCAKQFYQADLIEQIAEILRSTGLDACSLVLEITESAIMENGDEANTALSQLREMGIELSIDDFGTGYSSLGRLHTFPINVLKIDRSFVSPMDANNRNLEIIEIIVTLADKLGMDVTAEGVETQEQLALVRKLKCEYGQGYFFSRPLDSSAAEALIMANPRW
ncbi:MAG: EAL domain-containing protein [Spirirestis rafaelensis WJT71-NPBG6]|jgi:diguanylate cyclase (GGDEF)-like protein|nr:EAL domain-containing protein [Spirirestis rafaelensis WJT71-NPBG6]